VTIKSGAQLWNQYNNNDAKSDIFLLMIHDNEV